MLIGFRLSSGNFLVNTDNISEIKTLDDGGAVINMVTGAEIEIGKSDLERLVRRMIPRRPCPRKALTSTAIPESGSGTIALREVSADGGDGEEEPGPNCGCTVSDLGVNDCGIWGGPVPCLLPGEMMNGCKDPCPEEEEQV